MEQFVQEENIDFGQFCNFLDAKATTNGFGNIEETVILGLDDFLNKLVIGLFSQVSHFIMIDTDFQ